MKLRSHQHYLLITFIVMFGLINILSAETLVNFENVYPKKVISAGFTLNKDQAVTLQGQFNLFHHSRHVGNCQVWILNSDTREVVWESRRTKKVVKAEKDENYSQSVELKAGNYEAYLSTFHDYEWHRNWHGFHSFLSMIFDDDWNGDFYDNEHLYESIFLKLEGDGQSISAEQLKTRLDAIKDKALFSLTGMQDEEYREQAFSLDKPVRIRVYAIGEARWEESYDFGWIINLDTRKQVWQFDYRHGDPAGGASKNRKYDDVLSLEPGAYKAVFMTDDSHSFEEWNSIPPNDPEFWGLTVWAETDEDKASFIRLENEEDSKDAEFVSFVKVRDDKYYSSEFILKEKTPVRIYAIGEGREGEMFDYGHIMNVKSHKTVWEMEYRDTTPAGGDSKNRLFEGIIHLEPGQYRVIYQTDDSHAYHSWNTSAPFNKEYYGIRLFAPKESIDKQILTGYVEKDDKSLLAKLIEIGDDERARAVFEMPSDGKISIYAIGEGSGGEMYDYGYIKEINSGKVVWKMTYEETRHAGGARKNRVFDETIDLKAGKYEVTFKTDDSHSADDWNENPPRDASNWGITVRLASN